MRRQITPPLLLALTLSGSLIAACGGPKDRADSVNPGPRPVDMGDGDVGDGDGDVGDGDVGDGDGDGDGDVGDGDGDVGDGDGDGEAPPDGVEFNVPGAPVIELTLAGDSKVFTDTVSASCEVATSPDDGAEDFDPSSVFFELLDGDGDVVASVVPQTSDSVTFEGELNAAMLDSGQYSVRCVASDTGTPAKWGAAEEEVLIDSGLAIALIEPSDGDSLMAAQPFIFRASIDPVVLFDGDSEADLDGPVTLAIYGASFEMQEDPDKPGEYTATVDFEDPVDFPDVPDGETLVVVSAANGRGVVANLNFHIIVDGEPPTLVVNSPTDQAIIGKTTTFVFTIDDELSDVDFDSFRVEMDNGVGQVEEFVFGDDKGTWELDGNKVTLEATTSGNGTLIDLALNLEVADAAGNLATKVAEVTYHFDEHPPLIALDPPYFRVNDRVIGECSHAFDPVGSEAVDWGQQLVNLANFRAVIWDVTNEAQGQMAFYLSKVNEATVRHYVRPGGTPLAIDTDNDGVCDDVETVGSQFKQFTKVPIAGIPHYSDGSNWVDYGDASFVTDPVDPPIAGICALHAAPVGPPLPLCIGNESDMYVVPTHGGNGGLGQSVLYAYEGDAGGAFCTGREWDLRAQLGSYEGWICAAVVAEDNAGNRSVSEPTPHCFNQDSRTPQEVMANDPPDDLPSCWDQDPAVYAPDCTDTCVPRVFEPSGVIYRKI